MEYTDYTQKLAKQVSELGEQLKQIDAIHSKFHDITIEVSRWGTERISSALANKHVEDVDFVADCGCCSDAPMYALPFLMVEGKRVYSSPVRFYLGDHNACGYGIIERGGWEREMREAGMPESIILKTRNFLTEESPRYYSDDEDEDYLDDV